MFRQLIKADLLNLRLSWFAKQPLPDMTVFLLGCVIVAGIYGALTVRHTILFVQAVPGAIALIIVLTPG